MANGCVTRVEVTVLCRLNYWVRFSVRLQTNDSVTRVALIVFCRLNYWARFSVRLLTNKDVTLVIVTVSLSSKLLAKIFGKISD